MTKQLVASHRPDSLHHWGKEENWGSQCGAIAHSKEGKHQLDFDVAEMAANFASLRANRQ
jgi:hypothetical protein